MVTLHEAVIAAISHNNIGCVLYCHAKKLASRYAFRAAASILYPVVHTVEQRPFSAKDHEDPDLCDPEMLVDAQIALSEPSRYDDDLDEQDQTLSHFILTSSSVADDGPSFLVCGDAITLPLECLCFQGSFRHNMTTAAIVMNLALTYLNETDKDSFHALTLFESAYTLAIKEPVTCCISERVALISLNNATYILSELGDIELTNAYAETMIRLIESLPVSLDEAHREFRSRLMLNALVMKGQIIARAA